MERTNILVVTTKSWNITNFNKYKKDNWFLITEKHEFTYENVSKINPKYIFIPHWSWIIGENIWNNFECVVFHMADLPYGRWWSPLQNQIVRGIKNTKISAIKIDAWIDTGDIYLKKDVSLLWNANEIFMRASEIIFSEMIPYILDKQPIPVIQEWEILEFKRRKKEDWEIKEDFTLEKTYDYIRMLDGEWYPPAFIKFWNKILEFSEASLENNELIAKVKFTHF